MELKDRILFILKEQRLTQADFARAIKVTDSYVSNMLNGKRSNISEVLASLIEQLYGYSAQWILTGEGDYYNALSPNSNLSPAKKTLIAKLEKMSDVEVNATRVFVDSLDAYKEAFGVSSEES